MKPENDLILNHAIPNNYSFFSKPRKEGRGGGIATPFDNALKCIEIKDQLEYRSFEFQKIHAFSNGKKLQFVVVYRIPQSSKDGLTKSLFFEEFTSFLELILISNQKLIFLGDFNIHFDNKNDTDFKSFF